MKRGIKILSMIMALAVVVGVTSCGDEGPDIGDATGIPVSDGMFFAKVGEDPTEDHKLVSEVVEAPDFSVQAREGFVSGYLYLTAGDYNLVEVASRELVSTMGGTSNTFTDASFAASGCDKNSILEVTGVAADGASFNIAAEGLYKVAYDATEAEIVAHKIDQAGVIGSATEGGWGSDQVMAITGTPSADEVVFQATEVVLRKGEYKLRFNCRWTIERKIDDEGALDNTNGYVMLTNFGNTFADLQPGASNFAIADGDDAVYTVTLTWTPDGWSAGIERTGDAPEITFVPEENQWGIIGSATSTGWDSDTDLNYEGVTEGTYKWMGTFDLTGAVDANQFKFRTNDSWDVNIGYNDVTVTGDAGTLAEISEAGGNFALTEAGAGNYTITLTTSDDGANYTVNFVKN